ncbi:unnamed protein product [Peronospora farinosa]|uniref:Uncharacterized protein n=1 Tax=Peronospora farinosa TaxID=134698 RepID=A0ABN8BU76_9STRA|nr:unnamed protein product [Peronospora farinosa]
MSTQDGWTTSSTVTSDLLKWPYGEIKSDAKLLTRPSRHVTNQRTSNYDQTLSPVEQTIKRTMSPLVRTTRPTRHSQQSQQPLQPPEHTQKRPQPRQSLAQNLRPPQQLQPHSRPQPRRQSSTLARSPQGNLTTIRHPSGRFRPQGLSKTEMANHYDNNFEHWLGPPLPPPLNVAPMVFRKVDTYVDSRSKFRDSVFDSRGRFRNISLVALYTHLTPFPVSKHIVHQRSKFHDHRNRFQQAFLLSSDTKATNLRVATATVAASRTLSYRRLVVARLSYV